MTVTDLAALLPLLILGYGAVVLLVAGAYWRNHAGVVSIAVVLLALSFAAAVAVAPLAHQVTMLLRVDPLTLFFQGLLALGGLAIAFLSVDYLSAFPAGRERYYALLLFAVLGMGVLASSVHFASFFLGLETVSVSLFGLIGFALRRPASQEGGIKYLVLAGTSLSFLLLGMAFLYFQYGTMEFGALAAAARPASLLVLLGLGLMLVGFAYKLALAPFHMWAPDVYQGAPAPISALVATGSKAAMLALLLRFAPLFLGRDGGGMFTALMVLAILTMFTGNLLALLQRNLKRLLAYSSVAHMGYLLIPLLAGSAIGTSSLAFYFVSYFVTTIAAFGVVAALSDSSSELEDLDDYRGLGFARPVLAGTLGLAMISLAGIPLTIGFMAKFYIFAAAAQARLWLLLIIGVLNSGLSAYYYLRVLAALYTRPAEARTWRPVRRASALTLTVLSAALVAFGIYPGPLIGLTQRMAAAWLGGGGGP